MKKTWTDIIRNDRFILVKRNHRLTEGGNSENTHTVLFKFVKSSSPLYNRYLYRIFFGNYEFFYYPHWFPIPKSEESK